MEVQPTYPDAHHDLCAARFEGRDPNADENPSPTDQTYLEAALVNCDAAVRSDPKMSMAHETRGLILDVLQR